MSQMMMPRGMSDSRTLEGIAIRVVKEIRHMEVITYDPEAQRILKLVLPALREAYNLALPEDDGKTRHVTTEKDIAFKVDGVSPVEASTTTALRVPWTGNCEICKVPHNPRLNYDHAPIAPGGK